MQQGKLRSDLKDFLNRTEFSDAICLGPQLSLRATYDSEEGYLSGSKGFSSYSSVVNGNTMGFLLSSIIESFENHHGTVRSACLTQS
jgi:hypothetical protein